MMNELAHSDPVLAVAAPTRPQVEYACRLLPPRSMVGQLTLDQHIGVRIPGGQPTGIENLATNFLNPILTLSSAMNLLAKLPCFLIDGAASSKTFDNK